MWGDIEDEHGEIVATTYACVDLESKEVVDVVMEV